MGSAARRTKKQSEPFTSCRLMVEAAMQEMIANLQSKGLQPPEIALALADAAEDYVIRLAGEKRTVH
ncbi:hypothetical protein [Neorhizobium petrolearium]|uniref:hypothetical protein n=1 Tax=Neorhizobium petrolearium TaxID=515361 RepID=UPI003F16267E